MDIEADKNEAKKELENGSEGFSLFANVLWSSMKSCCA